MVAVGGDIWPTSLPSFQCTNWIKTVYVKAPVHNKGLGDSTGRIYIKTRQRWEHILKISEPW